MRDILHDEIDQYEQLTSRAAAIVAETRDALRGTKQVDVSFDEMFSALAEVVGDALAGLTTEAARAGMAMAKRRAVKVRGS